MKLSMVNSISFHNSWLVSSLLVGREFISRAVASAPYKFPGILDLLHYSCRLLTVLKKPS